MTTIETYPIERFGSGAFNFHIGTKDGWEIVFPDPIKNVILLNLNVMQSSKGVIIMKNRTSTIGNYQVGLVDPEDNLISSKYAKIRANEPKKIWGWGKIRTPNHTNNLKKIFFKSVSTNMNILNSFEKNYTEYELEVIRDPLLQPVLDNINGSEAVLKWGANLTGTDYRLVQRVKNAYRNIADESDVVVLENVTGSSIVLSNLVPVSEYVFVLQTKGQNWYDVGQVIFKTPAVEIQVEKIGSKTIKVSWPAGDSDLKYTVVAKSINDTKSVVATGRDAIIRDLLPGVEYEVQLFAE